MIPALRETFNRDYTPEQYQQLIAGVEARLFSHPWVAAVEAGKRSRADLRLFARQQQRIISSDLRSVALLVHRYGDSPSGRFFSESLKTETTALEALAGFTRALGGEAEGPADADVLAGAQAYTHFVAWLAMYGSDAEFAAAFLVNLPVLGQELTRSPPIPAETPRPCAGLPARAPGP